MMRVRSSPRFVMPLAAGLVLALWGFAPPASASQVRPVNLEEMTAHAATIFSGHCTRVTQATDPVLGVPVILATFTVDEMVKGRSARELTVKLIAPEGLVSHERGGEAGPFREGEEVVVFLYGESKLGFSNTVGLEQGKFTVIRDKQGAKLALNALPNRHLFQALSPQARERLGDSVGRWEGLRGIEPTELLEMAARLAGGGRTVGPVPK